MRVTNKMIADNVFRNATAHLEKLNQLQNQLASGKRVTKPSDDPTAINQSMLVSNVLSDQDEYVRNIGQIKTWLDTADSTIGDAATVLQRARELAVQGASDTSSAESRTAISKEIVQLKQQLQGIANTQLAGRYIFAGSQTLTEPYPAGGVPAGSLQHDNSDPLVAAIGPGQSIAYNQTGVAVFGANSDADNAFAVLDDLANALDSNDTEAISAQIDRLDARLQNFSLQRADVGGKRNRVTLLEDRYQSLNIGLRQLKSDYEDADIPELISNFQLSTQVYQASLSASAKIMQPTLMDFLR